MPRFEATIVFSADHKERLQTYADSMGWTVAPHVSEGFINYTSDNDDEDYMLQDVNQALGFYESHEDIRPVSWRIVRVIRDDDAKIDEITEVTDDAGPLAAAV